MVPQLYITRTPDAVDFDLPSYPTKHHVGLTLQAAIGNPVNINPGERVHIPIGFAIGIPQGFCGQIVSHSELVKKHGIIVSDSPHLLEPADRLPIFVLLQNVSAQQYILRRGEVIAELVVMPAVQVCWQEIQSDVKTQTTQDKDMVIENTDNIPEKNSTFTSTRRTVRSIRDRYKTSDEK